MIKRKILFSFSDLPFALLCRLLCFVVAGSYWFSSFFVTFLVCQSSNINRGIWAQNWWVLTWKIRILAIVDDILSDIAWKSTLFAGFWAEIGVFRAESRRIVRVDLIGILSEIGDFFGKLREYSSFFFDLAWSWCDTVFLSFSLFLLDVVDGSVK